MSGTSALLAHALDALGTPVAVLDPAGEVLLANAAWRGLAWEGRPGDGDVEIGGRWYRQAESPLPEGRLIQLTDITDLKAAEASAELFRQVFDLHPDPFTLSTFPGGRLVEVNQIWCALTGVSREDALGRTPGELGLWSDPREREALFAELGERGHAGSHQTGMVIQGGPARQMLLTARILEVQGERCVLVAGKDITDLTESEARYQALFELSPEGISLSRVSDATFVEVNAAWEALFGFSRQEALGLTAEGLGILRDPEELAVMRKNLPEPGILWGHTLDLVRKDGTRLVAELKGMVLDIQGEQCLLAMLRDITRESDLKRALLATEERFKAITGGLKDYLLILDPEGRITYINHPPPDMPLADVLGRSFPASADPETVALGRTAFEACVRNRLGISYGTPHPRPDGTRGWFDIRLEPVLAGGELQAVVVLAFDRSDARLAEEAERRASKAESLVLMAGSIAHDFNNLFAALQASLEIAGFQTHGQAEVRATLDTAQEVLRRAITLSWKMNEFSGRALTSRGPLDLGSLLPDWASRQHRHGRTLDLELAPVPMILADPKQVRLILNELLGNAWEAMDEDGSPDGRVTVKVFRDASPDAPGQWPAPRPKVPETVCLEFANDGPCPAPGVVARMFDPFFTTRFAGRGLGLASVLGLLKAHGAGIQVLPGDGRGLALRLHFPPGPW